MLDCITTTIFEGPSLFTQVKYPFSGPIFIITSTPIRPSISLVSTAMSSFSAFTSSLAQSSRKDYSSSPAELSSTCDIAYATMTSTDFASTTTSNSTKQFFSSFTQHPPASSTTSSSSSTLLARKDYPCAISDLSSSYGSAGVPILPSSTRSSSKTHS